MAIYGNGVPLKGFNGASIGFRVRVWGLRGFRAQTSP